jgi:hypothetical protein
MLFLQRKGFLKMAMMNKNGNKHIVTWNMCVRFVISWSGVRLSPPAFLSNRNIYKNDITIRIRILFLLNFEDSNCILNPKTAFI